MLDVLLRIALVLVIAFVLFALGFFMADAFVSSG
jgi:hypothetical protein